VATAEEFKLLIQDALRRYDPTIRLESGSPADVQVVQPLVRRFEPDALNTDLLLFAKERLAQEYPTLQTGEGSAIIDAVIKPMQVLLEPFVREIRAIRRNQSLIDPDILNKDEADAIVSNLFVSRNTGEYARIRVRIYFENPTGTNVGSTNVAFTVQGKRFLPLGAQSITAEQMLFNQDGELFYFDVDYVAEGQGSGYNVAAGQVIGVASLNASTSATNLRKAEGGRDEETTFDLISRAEQSIGERSLTTVPGIIAKLFDTFTSLRILQVIGFNDEEMTRDVIEGGNLGPPVIFGVDGTTSDDGDGDGYTPFFDSGTANFTAALGPVGTDLSEYVLTAWVVISGDITPVDYDLKQVEGAAQISISDDYTGTDRIPEPLTNRYWVVRKRVLTLSDVPGGILFPDIGGRTVDVPSDTIHVGGCTDFYVIGAGYEEATLSVSLFGSFEPALRNKTARTFTNTEIWIESATISDFAKIIVGTSSIRLLSGTSQDTYRVIGSTWNGGASRVELIVDKATTATESALVFDVTDSIDIGLIEPKEVLLIGDDLRTYAGSDLIDTVGGTVWADYGITTSHYLEILNGDDVGVYTISSLSSTAMYVSTTLSQTDSPIQFRILAIQDAGIELPLVRPRTVELLDASLEPTGDYVPYRHPIDAQSRSFQNPGRGAKAGSDTVITDDTLAVNTGVNPRLLTSSNVAIDYYALGVRPGDIVNVDTGDNTGYYVVASDGVGGSPAAASGLNDYELLVTEDLTWTDAVMNYAVGEPSYGSFRIYFLEPVGFSVGSETLISVTLSDETVRRFRPDPTLWDVYLPTDLTTPTLETAIGSAVVSAYPPGGGTVLNTAYYGVENGDRTEITFAPIVGSIDLHTGSHAVDGKTLLLDLGDGPERIVFSGTITIDDMITQINTQASRNVAAKYEVAATKFLMLRSDQEVTLTDNSADGDDGTALVFGATPTTHNPWLTAYATFAGETIPNDSPYKGYWFVNGLTSTSVTLEDEDGVAFNPLWAVDPELGHYTVFSRSSQQSVTASEMSQQRDSLGLYYFDVECISEGHGDTWNLDPDVPGTITGYASEGWDASVEDTDFSFSMAEEPWIHITPRVLLADSDNDPSVYEELVGRSFQITYDRDALVEEVHSYVRDSQNRVVCESPLARALLPIFVRTDVSYRDGASEVENRASLVTVIKKVIPERFLEVSDMVDVIVRSGAEYVQLPITVIGIAHKRDRSIEVERSQDLISTERLSALIPDDDGTTSEGASWIQLTRS